MRPLQSVYLTPCVHCAGVGACSLTKSTAVLRTMRHLDGLWFLLYCFVIIPSFIRDFVYDAVASNRYRIFGKAPSCQLPPIGLRRKITKNQVDSLDSHN